MYKLSLKAKCFDFPKKIYRNICIDSTKYIGNSSQILINTLSVPKK